MKHNEAFQKNIDGKIYILEDCFGLRDFVRYRAFGLGSKTLQVPMFPTVGSKLAPKPQIARPGAAECSKSVARSCPKATECSMVATRLDPGIAECWQALLKIILRQGHYLHDLPVHVLASGPPEGKLHRAPSK